MSEAGLQTAGEITRLENTIADQATTINSLKRALAASESDLKMVSAAIRVVNRREMEPLPTPLG